MKLTAVLAALAAIAVTPATARNSHPAPHLLRRQASTDVDPSLLYPARNLSVPIDHFHNESQYAPHSSGMFPLRYWFDATYYKPGGPVIVFQSGEADASPRLPILQKGIIYQLSKATGGIGVIMEHRYYGESFPVKNLTTESFRFLTTQQALADQAYFAQHVKFEGMEDMDLTAPGTPYLTYGGSYSGAFVAFMRVEYPELYWGAISSSGVTEAIYDFWEYNEPIREYGPPMCVAAHQKLLNVVDTVLMKENKTLTMELKTTMGMEGLTNDKDFANVAGYAFQYWQNRNWDPQVDDLTFDQYCGNITSQEKTFPVKTTPLTKNVTAVLEQSAWANETKELTIPMLNYIGWINETFLATCEGSISECWGESNATSTMYTDKSLDNYDILSWPYQWCTEWGYLVTGTGVPKDELPLTSRLMDLEYLTSICRYAFNITKPPDTAIINKYGGFNISYPRLALIGGQADPWRPSTPLATLDKPDRLNTTSTTSQPVILIEGAVHHWDENGVFPNETTKDLPPAPVAQAQAAERQFVLQWMAEYKQHCIASPKMCTHNYTSSG